MEELAQWPQSEVLLNISRQFSGRLMWRMGVTRGTWHIISSSQTCSPQALSSSNLHLWRMWQVST